MMPEKKHLTREQFATTCDELLEAASLIVNRLRAYEGRYWTEVDGVVADYLRGYAHTAHKAAVAIAGDFND